MKSYLFHFKIRCGVTQAHLVKEDGNVGKEVKDEDAFEVAGEDLGEITFVLRVQ